jgi:hypothetical protein
LLAIALKSLNGRRIVLKLARPTIHSLRVLEAKDFLVQQTAEQAALKNAPLSDLEKRMMSFTEVDECPDPVAVEALSP